MINLRENVSAEGSCSDTERVVYPHPLVINPLMRNVGFRVPACPEFVIINQCINALARRWGIGVELKEPSTAQMAKGAFITAGAKVDERVWNS